MGTRENKEQEPAKTTPEIMRTAVFLSLIAAARAFAPPSILRASVVVKNEADAASTVPESYEKISIARRESCRARCAALPRCRCPRNASPVALKLHVTHAFGTLRRQKSTPAETHQH